MYNIIKYLLFVLVVIAFASCSKEDIKRKIEKTTTTEFTEDDTDTTAMTPQEAFSSALVSNILDIEDEELQNYLEDEIFPIVRSSKKVTIDKISSSLYLLQYDEGGSQKNILLQKFYNPSNDEFFFEKRDVRNDAIKQFLK